MQRIGKRLAYILLLVVLLLVAGLLLGNRLLRISINTVAPRLLGVPASVERVSFRPLAGHMTISGLQIANPAGYSTNHLLQVASLHVDLVAASLVTDTIHIRLLHVEAPTIHYELIGRRSNIAALLEGLQPDEASETDAPPDTDAQQEKITIIDELRISAPLLALSTSKVIQEPIRLTPGDIILNNLGGPDQSTIHIIARVFNAISVTSINAAGSAGHFIDNTVRSASRGLSRVGQKTSEVVAGGAQAVSRGVGTAFRGMFGRRKTQPPAQAHAAPAAGPTSP